MNFLFYNDERTMTRCCRQRIRNGKTTWGPEDREEAAAIARGDGSVPPGLIPHMVSLWSTEKVGLR